MEKVDHIFFVFFTPFARVPTIFIFLPPASPLCVRCVVQIQSTKQLNFHFLKLEHVFKFFSNAGPGYFASIVHSLQVENEQPAEVLME